MKELTGLNKYLFNIKRDRVNERLKQIIGIDKAGNNLEKTEKVIVVIQMYMGRYFEKCENIREAVALINKISVLRREKIKTKQFIARNVFEYAKAA